MPRTFEIFLRHRAIPSKEVVDNRDLCLPRKIVLAVIPGHARIERYEAGKRQFLLSRLFQFRDILKTVGLPATKCGSFTG